MPFRGDCLCTTWNSLTVHCFKPRVVFKNGENTHCSSVFFILLLLYFSLLRCHHFCSLCRRVWVCVCVCSASIILDESQDRTNASRTWQPANARTNTSLQYIFHTLRIVTNPFGIVKWMAHYIHYQSNVADAERSTDVNGWMARRTRARQAFVERPIRRTNKFM